MNKNGHLHDIIPIMPIDIESLPMLGFLWRPRIDYVPHDMVIQETTICSVSFRDPRTGELVSWAVDPRNVRDDRPLLKKIHALLTWAGENNVVLLHQNGNKFDVPLIEARIIKHQLGPLPRLTSIDTRKEADRFGFDYRRLDHLSKQAGGKGKREHRGWPMWEDIAHPLSSEAKRRKAIHEMVHYCEGDILELERVFLWLKPYMKTFPNANLWAGTKDGCPTCGSKEYKIQSAPTFTTTRAYQRLKCKNPSCGREYRKTISDKARKALVTGNQ